MQQPSLFFYFYFYFLVFVFDITGMRTQLFAASAFHNLPSFREEKLQINGTQSFKWEWARSCSCRGLALKTCHGFINQLTLKLRLLFTSNCFIRKKACVNLCLVKLIVLKAFIFYLFQVDTKNPHYDVITIEVRAGS